MQNDTEYSGKTIAFGGASQTTLGRALAEAFAQRGATILQLDREASGGLSTGTHVDALIWLSQPPVEVPFLQLSDADWAEVTESALLPAIRQMRAVGERMVARQQGCIVVVGGLSGVTGWPGYARSSVIDAALVALVRALACEWAIHNVRLVYLAYGGVQGEVPDALATRFAERAPLGQNATPDQIASVALYLTGPRASFTTGSVVRADGGWTSWGLLK
jgi:NAD(P)-dependent dehydrogenase (short-subunit alcohol dehydrogenase family)